MSNATERVRPMTADLLAEYSAVAGQDVLPAIDDTLMIRPERCRRMTGATARQPRYVPVKLTPTVSSHASGGTSSSGLPL